MKVQIAIKSYYILYLDYFVKKLHQYVNKELFDVKTHIVMLPRKIEKYTLLRSPHADTKARDQFERRTHKRLITLTLGESTTNIFLLKNLLERLQVGAVGVEFTITYESNATTRWY